MILQYPDTPWDCRICGSIDPLAPPQLIGIYGSPMGRVWDILHIGVTLRKINMEPEKHWVVEENSLPKVNCQVPC